MELMDRGSATHSAAAATPAAAPNILEPSRHNTSAMTTDASAEATRAESIPSPSTNWARPNRYFATGGCSRFWVKSPSR